MKEIKRVPVFLKHSVVALCRTQLVHRWVTIYLHVGKPSWYITHIDSVFCFLWNDKITISFLAE